MPHFRNTQIDLVIDVRSRLEFFLGHLDGAINIPVDRLPHALAERPEVTPSTRILVYCAAGPRATAAASALGAAGYSRVVNAGGIAAAKAEYRTA